MTTPDSPRAAKGRFPYADHRNLAQVARDELRPRCDECGTRELGPCAYALCPRRKVA